MNTLFSVLSVVFEGSVALCKFLFTTFFYLFVPFVLLGVGYVMIGFEGFLYAMLLVRLIQFICLAVFLASGLVCLVTVGIIYGIGRVMKMYGYPNA